MSSIATIALIDATPTTPVTRNFVPDSQGLLPNGRRVAVFEDRSANNGVPVGFGRTTITFAKPQKDRKTYQVDVKFEIPVCEVLSNSTVTGFPPAPTVSFRPVFEGRFILPERGTAQSRKDLRKMVYALMNDNMVVKSVEDLDPPL